MNDRRRKGKRGGRGKGGGDYKARNRRRKGEEKGRMKNKRRQKVQIIEEKERRGRR